MPSYRLHEFTIMPRPLPDPWGGVVPAAEYPFRANATMKQWANIELAQAHIAAAIKMLAEMDPELDAVPSWRTLEDERANKRQSQRQFGFLVQLAKHIARAYNALGVLWYNDPSHRVIFRKYFSGPPAATVGDRREVFAKSPNWGGLLRWYQKSEEFPIVPVNASSLGILPREARDLYNKYGTDGLGQRGMQTHRIHFVQQMTFVVTPQDNAVNDGQTRNIYNAGDIKNETMFSWTPDLYECVNIMGEPWSTEDQASDDKRCFFRGFDNRMMSVAVGNVPVGARPPNIGFYDWRAFSFDSNWDAVHKDSTIRVAPPLRSYLPYLAEVAESLNARHPYETIQDSRAFPVWNNVQTVNANGGIRDAVASALQTQSSMASEQAAGDPGLRAASQMTSMLTTAVGPAVPFPGNIITMVVGGVASLVMTALNGTVVKGRISSHGRDDLGRYKIVLDPQVLYANIETTTPPFLPDSDSTVPTGFQESEQSATSMADMLRYRDFAAFKSYRDNRWGITEALSRKALENAIAYRPYIPMNRRQTEDNTTTYLIMGAAAAAIAYFAFAKGPVPSVSKPTQPSEAAEVPSEEPIAGTSKRRASKSKSKRKGTKR